MPELKNPAAAVCLEEADDVHDSVTVLITVYSPAGSGGQSCEIAAAAAMSVMKSQNAQCRLEQCCYLSGLHLFSMKLHATFVEEKPTPEIPVQRPSFTIKMGLSPLEHAISFQASQQILDPTVAPQKDALWIFRIEELIPPGSAEQNTPSEPFNITVNCTNTTETYSGCQLTSICREDDKNGLILVRKGTAAKRSFINLL